MRLSNKQLSFIISFCIMGIVVLTAYNIQLASEKEEEFLYELSFDEKTIEELLKEPELKPDLAELETHQAYNEAAKSRFAEEVENFKSLDEIVQESQSENPDPSAGETADFGLDPGFSKKFSEKLKEQKLRLAENKPKENNQPVNIKRRTTITYSLVDRSHEYLANPVYTCESFGKVVINIKVDAYGKVTEATFNKSSSTTSNGCLVDNAIAYAYQSYFTSVAGKPEQIGTITYLFQGE